LGLRGQLPAANRDHRHLPGDDIGHALHQFDEFIGEGGEPFSVLGTSGFNSTSHRSNSAAAHRWAGTSAAFSADLFVNYTPEYQNYSSFSVTPGDHRRRRPIGGATWWKRTSPSTPPPVRVPGRILEGSSVYLNVVNLTNEEPPFYNGNTDGVGGVGASASTDWCSNPIGRIISVGFAGGSSSLAGASSREEASAHVHLEEDS
jgi:hypothetical protein